MSSHSEENGQIKHPTRGFPARYAIFMGRLCLSMYKKTSVVFHSKIGRALMTTSCLTPFPIRAYFERRTLSSERVPS